MATTPTMLERLTGAWAGRLLWVKAQLDQKSVAPRVCVRTTTNYAANDSLIL